jgi:putative hydrolase of the HAD superfamily
MPEAILFELDRTLLDNDAAVRQIASDQHRVFSDTLYDVPRKLFVDRVLELEALGYTDRAALFEQITCEFYLPQSFALTLTSYFSAHYLEHCRLFPEVELVLVALQQRGLKVGIVTNGPFDLQGQKIQSVGIARLVDVLVVSEHLGTRQLDAEIFQRALDRLGIRSDDTWHAGDHPVFDVEAAHAAGIHPIWKRSARFAAPPSDVPSIDNLAELLELLDGKSPPSYFSTHPSTPARIADTVRPTARPQ